MIAKLQLTQSNAQQNVKQLQNPTVGVTIDNESASTEPPPTNGQQSKPPRSLNAFYWYQIFALDSAFGETRTFSAHIEDY